jgi:hypothetical protein
MNRTERNLAVQGYRLSSAEVRQLRWALRLPTGLCFALVALGLLFALGDASFALILGAVLLSVCGLVTVTNFCIPSTLLGFWWRWRGTQTPSEMSPAT